MEPPIWGGSSRLTDDITGDGVRDFLVKGDEWVQIFDGANGSLWWERIEFSTEYHFNVVDLNGDGVSELLLDSLTYAGGLGRLEILLGGTNSIHLDYVGTPQDPYEGYRALLDVNGDGWLDLISDTGGQRLARSGLDATLLWQISEPLQSLVATVDDYNNDGIRDLFSTLMDGDALIDGATGLEIWRTSRGLQDSLSKTEILALDVTADGVEDLILASPFARNNEKGWIEVRDGLDGSLVWRRKGADRDDQLGRNLELEDLTGDGFPEIVTRSESLAHSLFIALYVLDARTGERIWRREWNPQDLISGEPIRADLNRDGIRDFVYAEVDRSDHSWLNAVDGSTGTDLWEQLPIATNSYISDLKAIEIDGDGVLDFLVGVRSILSQSESQLWALSGTTGRQLWSRFASTGHTFAFSLACFQTETGRDAVCTVDQPKFPSETAWLVAYALDSGEELWRSQFEQTLATTGALRVVDLNQDQRPELLALPRQYWSSSYDELRLHDLHDQGSLRWHAQGVRIEWGAVEDQVFTPEADWDGDGWLDFVYRGAHFGVVTDSKLIGVSGRNGTWKSGVSLSEDTISASQGGKTTLRVETHEPLARRPYRFIFSENGSGLTSYAGLDLPFAPGIWLTKSLAEIYPPGVISNPTGKLDDEGDAQLDLQIPAAALIPYIGRELAVGIITLTQGVGGAPEWVSGAALLEVTP